MTQGFANRNDAARQLATRLEHLRGELGVVLAVPRGGVPIGAVVAQSLGWPLDVVLTKKIGHPSHPEFAVGAVSMESYVLNPDLELPEEYIDTQVSRIRLQLHAKHRLYLGRRTPLVLTGHTVVIVDDGIATGQTMRATTQLVHRQALARVVVATPVSSRQALQRLSGEADEVICLLTPPDFHAVGQYYRDFAEVTDEQVIETLEHFEQPEGSGYTQKSYTD